MSKPRDHAVTGPIGAPMGRPSDGTLDASQRLQLFRVRLNRGGYDRGGAYWGIGQPLWCAMDHRGRTLFFRARDRDAARAHVRTDGTPEARFYR